MPVNHINVAKANVVRNEEGKGININNEIQALLNQDSCWKKVPANVRANTPLARSVAGQNVHLYSVTARVFGDLTQAITSAYSQDTALT